MTPLQLMDTETNTIHIACNDGGDISLHETHAIKQHTLPLMAPPYSLKFIIKKSLS